MPHRKTDILGLGKRWVKEVFEHISNELKDTVVIVHWDLQDNDPEYRLYFRIAGQDDAETLSFTRGTLKTCGKSHDAVRRRVEANIRNRLLFLSKH